MASRIALRRELPAAPVCTDCGTALVEPFGWCGGCLAASCFRCGRAHYCTPACPAKGCLAGLCVRVVEGGRLSERWGIPTDGSPNPPVPGNDGD